MKVSEPTREGVIVKFNVEMTADEMKPYFDKAFKKAAKKIRIDGFRAGKVPASVIEKRFGDAIRADAVDAIVEEVYPKALNETKVQPLTPAKVEDVDFDPESHLKFTSVIEVAPEFEANNWKGLKIEKEVIEVKDEDVDRHIDGMRREKAIISDKPEDGVAEGSDRITADLQEVDKEGKPVEGNKHEDATLELGMNVLGEDTDKQLEGIKVGETRNVSTSRAQKDEKGKEKKVDFFWEVTAKKIEGIELPELDDDFAAIVNEEYKNLDDLKKKVREQMQEFAQYRLDQKLENVVVDALVKAHEIEVPPTLKEQTLGQMVEEQKKQYGDKIDDNQLRVFLAPAAENQLRWYFLRSRMVQDLKIEATEEDIEKHLNEYAEKNDNVKIEELKAYFKAPQAREQLTEEIVQKKLMDEVKAAVKFKEKKVDFLSVLR